MSGNASRGSARRRWQPRALRAVALAAMVLLLAEPLPATAGVFAGALDSTLTQPPVLGPGQPVPSVVDGLRYGDPTEGVSLIDVPKPDTVGEAHTSFPVDIPPGRLGWQPEVGFEYGSRQGNGWMGVGWDAGAPSISVDTRWGVPRYDRAVESETYSFEGEQLSPTAHRSPQLSREAERLFTKRVEGDYQRIQRHGDSPATYWWEVHDKVGNKYFYGRTPDGDVPEAILRADGNAAYWWGLVEKHDISLNTVTYFYDRVEDSGVGDGSAGPKGAQLYLARINYSGSLDTDDDDGPNLPRFGAYDVSLTRDAELGQPRRRDVSIDARTGALRVTSQLLRQVDVTFCAGRSPLNPLQCDGNPGLVRSYRLNYDYGPFDKSRLRSVGQAGADGRVFATTEFDYFEDVLVNGSYQGFEDDRTWNTGSGDNVGGGLADVKPTALGGSSTSMGDGRVYLGFNPLNPDKGFSIGGGLEMNGSNSTSEIELVDVNGDNLPDKVWKDSGTIRYRLNQGRPGGSTVFEDPPRVLPGLPGLPEEESFGVSIGPEAYFFVGDVMYHHGWSFNKSTAYFSDVNADGMIDFVRNGTVYFNRLDANKRPLFAATSAGTAIPITDQSISPAVNVDDSAYEATARQQFPLQDTLRRWIAPWDGTVTIEGPVVLRNAADSPDGVRVAIQKNGGELWSTTIPKGATGPRVPQTGPVTVAKGDRIYFRLQSVDDGAADAVDWDPVVTYTNIAPALDANGLDVSRFVASEEFTLAGRTGIFTQMPMDGTVRLTGVVRKTAATTDDVRIVVEHNGVNLVTSTPPIRWDQVGDIPVTAEFPVRAPRTDPSCQHQGELCIVDRVSLRLGVDSPIDVTALKWLGPAGTAGPQLFYVNASKGGQPVTTHDQQGRPIIQLRPPYDISLYGQSNRSTPQSAWTVPDDGDNDHAEVRTIDVKAEVRLSGPIDPSLLPSTVAFTVKGEGRSLGKGILNLPVPLPPAPGPNPVPPFVGDDLELRFQATENQRIWFDYSSPDPRLGPLMVTDTRADVAGDDIPPAGVPAAHHWPLLIVRDDQGDIFPQPFRGWGYAGYNGDGARAGQPVVENDLVFRRSDFQEGVENRPENADDTNPIQGKAYPYAPDPEQDRWQGPKQSVRTDDQDLTPRPNIRGATWGAAGGASASRVGPDSVKADGGGAGSGRAPTITGRAEEDTFGGGLAVGPLGFGGGVAFGFSRGMRDFQDMNGDGYPDIVAGKIQYTTQVGGLDPVLRDLDQSAVRTDRSYSGTVSGSGATPSIKDSPNGDTTAATSDDGGGINGNGGGKDSEAGGGDAGGSKGKGKGKSAAKKAQSSSADAPSSGPSGGGGDNADAPNAEEPSGTSAGVNLGFSGSLGHSESNHDEGFNDVLPYDPSRPVETDLADLNGDGLPDRVTVDGGEIKVRWNLGYRFSEETTFPGGAIEEGQSDSFSVGATVGFNAGRFDFSGGVNIQKEEEHADIAWIDLNGDGLPDRLESEYTGSPPNLDRHKVSVRFNTGAGLTGPIDFGAFQDNDIARSENFGISGGADFTVGIGPLCWPVRLCYIILNPGGHGGRSISSTRNSLVDIDGDGLPDSVTSSDDSELHVSRNRTGRTNMLKTIRRPLGARVDLDYNRDGNTVDQPYSVWTLNKVSVFDGHAGDGVDDTVTRYDYSDDNYFDFTEREMLGYGTIIEENLDGNGAVYRKFVRTYLNGNYYERGLLESETLQDGAGTAFVSTVNTYEPVDSASPAAPVSTTSTVASIFPRKVKVEERWHGAGGAPATQSEIRTTYDARGNAVEIVDLGGPGAADDAVARTTFTECRTSHADSFPWTQVPQALTIVNAGGQVLRKRDSVSPCDYAAITSMEEHLSAGGDGPRAHTDVEYADPGGEVNLVIGPENARGDREEMFYEYDRLTGNLVKIVERGLGLETTMTWDNRFGRLVSVTDPNGAVTSFTYDPQGRLTSVTEPLEHGAQPARPTVTFSYSDTGPDPWVHAEHFDAANPNNKIGTIRFVDGVGKEIQTKQDATVYDGEQKKAFDVRVVSGSTYFDFLGRPVRQFYPITEPFSVDIDEFNFSDDEVTPTLVQYDVRDRVTKVSAPGDRVTETIYGFSAGLATAMVIDPEKKRAVTSTDVRGNDVGVERFYAGTSLATRYDYDPLQQLVGITEAGGARTTVGYDLLGRQVSVETPDAGKVEMGFDLASNMVSKVTPNLRSAGRQVTYEHEFNRLVAVRYPDDPSNNVTYAYGQGGAPGNTAGRIARMVDGARTQDRAYDKAGNLIEQRDVMKVHNLSPTTAAAHTFTTRFAADSMGRILSMTYPDGEVVTNAYDSGGLVRSVAGKKGSDSYRYVDRLEYDKFGFRRLLTYGNGVSTQTSYDSETTWMSGQVVNEGSKLLQNLTYSYDMVGNPLTRVDDIPVPKANEMGGPSTQTFKYDDLHRLTDATGTYDFPAKKRRDFTLALTYDAAGRVATKKQVDRIDGREQNGGTFDLSYGYERGQSHGPTKVGSRTYSWDANGNNTGWAEDQGGQRRTITWDEEDRASSIADQGNTTTYRYDDDGTLALERGPQGELEYVNRYFTAVNGGVAWKQFFAGDLQVATKEVKANATEQKRYFLTGDLIGSVSLVTEADGDVFEHLEYFPGGQIWVREKSEVYRQPTLYAGLYHDEFRGLYRTQARWYEPRDGVLLSPDPLLTGSPGATVPEPRLLGAYTYSFDNPTRYIDRSGRAPLEALTSFVNGDIPVPFGMKRTMARRTDFEKNHPKFAKWFGTKLDANKTQGKFFKVTEFLDEMYSIEVGIGPKGLKLKRVGVFKKVPKFKAARAFFKK